jgi:hypothetical protein
MTEFHTVFKFRSHKFKFKPASPAQAIGYTPNHGPSYITVLENLNRSTTDRQFVAQDASSQSEAAALLASHGLDSNSRKDPTNKWTPRDSLNTGYVVRVLYQWYGG